LSTASPGLGLVERYGLHPHTGYDEMVAPGGAVRPAWSELAGALDALGRTGLEQSSEHAARVLSGDGVVYRPSGSEEAQQWELDPLPLLLEESEWLGLEAGLAQRARLLDALLTDLYGKRAVLRSGVLPPEIAFAHQGFLRQCDQLRVPGPHQLFTVAADLARDDTGSWVVLSDRAASPSGAGFAMENRRVSSRVLPELYHRARIQRLGPFFHAMRLGLQEIAPTTAEAPRVVLLTSGPMSETAYDQAFLSQLLGYPLVSGTDLSVREGRLMARGIDGLEQVDVVLRRVDSDFCDPLELRPDSQLGVPGLLEAARLGSVSIVNSPGSGVLENPGLLPFLPALCRTLLDEDLALPSASTWWCGDPQSLSHVRAELAQLVLKPLSRGRGRASIFGWELSAAGRADLLARIEAEPYLWVGQSAVAASTAPTFDGRDVTPRSLVLRSFAVAQGGGYQVLSGGLVRVAPEPDSLLVSSQAGALTKDAWVLASRRTHVAEQLPFEGPPLEMRHVVISPRMAEDFFWLGRYTERAEATARTLRAIRDRNADFNDRGEPAGEVCLEALLVALTKVTTTYPGFVGPAGATLRAQPYRELWALATDARRPGTLAHSLEALTGATRAVRDQLSSDTWLMITALDSAVRELSPDRNGTLPGDVVMGEQLTRVLACLLALSGLSAESMVRDLGWHFMESGRRLERAVQVVALLHATMVAERTPEVDGLVVESVLLSTESIITYRRRYASRPEVATVLELLLVDRENPRSVAHALDRLGANLSHIPHNRPLRDRVDDLVTQVRSCDLASLVGTVTPTGERPALDAFFARLLQQLRELSSAVELAYFEDVLAPLPLVEVIA
jgi:uncharacterized circularly permuted ATP-grasp superfamily protein/uncharacterized alpha-E superfamily protein